MDTIKNEYTRTLCIENDEGMHCRPSASFVKTANKFQSEIMVKKGNEIVNGKSIMGLLQLAVGGGVSFDITATGPDAEIAVNTLEKLVNNNFVDNNA